MSAPDPASIGRRACFAAAIAGLAPLRAGAAKKVFRIGVLDPDSADFADVWAEFVSELARLGFVQGRNVVFERRFGHDLEPEGIRRNAAELVRLNVDLIYAAHGSVTATAAKNATARIPIVFYSSADPVGVGLVSDLARPAGNVTGSSISAFETFPKSMQYLHEITGKLNRIVEINPSGTSLMPWFARMDEAIQATSRRLGVRFEYVEVGSIEALESVVHRLRRDGLDAAVVGDRAFLKPHQARIAQWLIGYRIPSIGDPDAGFLLRLEPDWMHLARKAAGYVARILNGTKPSDLPVEQTSRFSLVVNQGTAERIGLKIPESMRLRASRVVR